MKESPLPTTACGGSFWPPATMTSVYSLYMLPAYTPARHDQARQPVWGRRKEVSGSSSREEQSPCQTRQCVLRGATGGGTAEQ